MFSWKRRPTTHQRVELLAKLLECKFNGEMNILEVQDQQGGSSIPTAESALMASATERGTSLFDRKLEAQRMSRALKMRAMGTAVEYASGRSGERVVMRKSGGMKCRVL